MFEMLPLVGLHFVMNAGNRKMEKSALLLLRLLLLLLLLRAIEVYPALAWKQHLCWSLCRGPGFPACFWCKSMSN